MFAKRRLRNNIAYDSINFKGRFRRAGKTKTLYLVKFLKQMIKLRASHFFGRVISKFWKSKSILVDKLFNFMIKDVEMEGDCKDLTS